jgi:hypothetical protein
MVRYAAKTEVHWAAVETALTLTLQCEHPTRHAAGAHTMSETRSIGRPPRAKPILQIGLLLDS